MIQSDQDAGVFPSDTKLIYDNLASEDKVIEMIKGDYNLIRISITFGAWSMEHGAWSMEHGAWSMEHENLTVPDHLPACLLCIQIGG